MAVLHLTKIDLHISYELLNMLGVVVDGKRVGNHGIKDWLLRRMLDLLTSGDWIIKVWNIKGSDKKLYRRVIGYVDYNKDREGGTIYLDQKYGTPRVLIHELIHILFDNILDEEARNKSAAELRRVRGSNKFERWVEIRVLELESYFVKALSRDDMALLQSAIDRVKRH